MLRKLTPFLATFLAVLLDTAVIPVLYHGTYTIPLTLVVALCIGLLLGRLRGLLYGMIGGLLIDISAGTLGTMTFFFMAVGFLVELIVDESKDRRPEGFRFHLRRGIVAFVLYMLGEIAFGVYRYFVTAAFSWASVRFMLLRGLLFAALALALCPLFARIFLGKRAIRTGRSGKKREVKHF